MPNYPLQSINTELLRELSRSKALALDWAINRQPPSYEEAYRMYLAEYKFGTLLNSVTSDPQRLPIYQACLPDLKRVHLYIALAAWLRPPSSDWTWESDLPNKSDTLKSLQYGLTWQRNTKGFLIAARDLLGVEAVEMSKHFVRLQAIEAKRCADLLFSSRQFEH